MKPAGLLGGIEAGGTKFICGIAEPSGAILDTVRISTTSAATTLDEAASFFEAAVGKNRSLAMLSIGAFGPLGLKPGTSSFGTITATPKPGWSGTDLVGYFTRRLGGPVVLGTDVNCSSVGEHLFGSGRGLDSFCYVTIGTGIGVGVFLGGAPHIGANHLEAGHIRVARTAHDRVFSGTCPFHGDCLEGLACGPAIKARWGARAPDLPDDHPAWEMEAAYIAALCTNLTYVLRPHRIILGGGVMQRRHLYPLIRSALAVQLAGYDSSLADVDLETYIAEPGAGTSAGLWGAIASAYREVEGHWPHSWPLGAADIHHAVEK